MKNEFVLSGVQIDHWIDNDYETSEYVCHIMIVNGDDIFHCVYFDQVLRNIILQTEMNTEILVYGYIRKTGDYLTLIGTRFTVL